MTRAEAEFAKLMGLKVRPRDGMLKDIQEWRAHNGYNPVATKEPWSISALITTWEDGIGVEEFGVRYIPLEYLEVCHDGETL